MRILIKTIPHKNQRYDTCGDWQVIYPPLTSSEEKLFITVSDTGDWRYNAALAIHELVEALLCKAAGISQETVDAFDLAWGDREGEPGDDPAAPYHEQHITASEHEMDLLAQLGADWGEYEEALLNMFRTGDEE